LTSADLYASRDPFRSLWPKLFKASAVEAVAELKEKDSAVARLVRAMFAGAEQRRQSSQQIASQLQVVMKESGRTVRFESRERENGVWIHKSYVVKDRLN